LSKSSEVETFRNERNYMKGGGGTSSRTGPSLGRKILLRAGGRIAQFGSKQRGGEGRGGFLCLDRKSEVKGELFRSNTRRGD